MVMGSCVTTYLGTVDYQSIWDLQKHLAVAKLPNTFLLLEHPHTITLGRRGAQSDIIASKESLDAKGIAVHDIDRGGEVTYHGPGQLIGYPVLDLRSLGKGPLEYVRSLEQILLLSLSDFGISANLVAGKTGVWVNDQKIAAIGIKVSKGVTTHGFALNINTDLAYFDLIVPCGMPDCRVTSIKQVLGSPVDVNNVIRSVVTHFEQTMALKCVMLDQKEFYEIIEVPFESDGIQTQISKKSSDIGNE